MDGKGNNRSSAEMPIKKPDQPLPAMFFPSKRKERGRFYRNQDNDLSSPVYGTTIRTKTGERENPGSVN